MSDLEQLLPPRLHALADDLTAGLDLTGQASAARDRHRRQRRARIGVTAVAAAVIAVAVGVPTAFSALSAPDGGRVAGPVSPTTSASATPDPAAQARGAAQARAEAEAEARLAAASAAAESASAAASPGPYQQMAAGIDPAASATIAAEEARGEAELADALVALRSPVRLGAPPTGAPCPDAGGVLSQGLGTHVAYEQGSLTDGRGGCQWSSDGDAPMASPSVDRLTVGLGYEAIPVERVVSYQQQMLAVAAPGRSLRATATGIAPGAVLQRFVNGDSDEWSLFVPTADGAGTWMLSVYIGDDLAAADAGPALTQVARLAMTTWPG